MRTDADFVHYDRPDSVDRYRRATAGRGINYLLPEVYGPIFLEEARAAVAEAGGSRVRLLEFGCGAGMALHFVTEQLGAEGVDVELAVGADFVPAMVAAAQKDLDEFGTPWAKERTRFLVASNETLASELAQGLGEPMDSLAGTFQLAIGVNTFRYNIRHNTDKATVDDLRLLLAPRGRVVVIDMNDRFPYGIKPKRREPGQTGFPIYFGARFLPTLEGYAAPFAENGFEVVRRGHMAWVPHSSNGFRYWLARAASPVLERLVPDRAMRSFFVARKN